MLAKRPDSNVLSVADDPEAVLLFGLVAGQLAGSRIAGRVAAAIGRRPQREAFLDDPVQTQGVGARAAHANSVSCVRSRRICTMHQARRDGQG